MSVSPHLLILVGMMGSGKSTVGQLVARHFGVAFVDSDHVLEQRCGVPVTTMFEVEGEERFRVREAAILDEYTKKNHLVLATGGGAVLREDNRAHMKERGLVIYLEASSEELWRRLHHDKSRPLLQGIDAQTRLAQLLQERAPLYRACAHMTFASGLEAPRDLAQRIVRNPHVAGIFQSS